MALNSKKHCDALFVGLSKAFDAVNHCLLLNKLPLIGFHHATQQWFNTYLAKCFQCVKVVKVHSNLVKIEKGVPQGSVPWHGLFTIYKSGIASTLVMIQCNIAIL